MDVTGSWTREERVALRGVLLGGIAVGVAYLAAFAWLFPGWELDFQAYYLAGRAVLEGEAFVGWAITDGTFLTEKAYVYPPVTVLAFLPYALVDTWTAPYLVHVALLAVGLVGVGVLSVRFIEAQEAPLPRADRWLVVAFCVLSLPAVLPLTGGNVDPLALAGLALGLLAIERGREVTGGSLWATVALFKLFPAFLGVWLLHRRADRAVAAALVVGIGANAVGVALFGVETYADFVAFVIEERSREAAFDGRLDPTYMWVTLRRPLSQVLGLGGHALTAIATAAVAPFVYLTYRDARSTVDHAVAYLATLIALLVTIVPSTMGYMVYVYFPAVALVFVVDDRRVRRLFLAGLALLNVPVFAHHVTAAIESLGADDTPLAVVDTVATAVLSFVSVPLFGLMLLLAGCVLWSLDRERAPVDPPSKPT